MAINMLDKTIKTIELAINRSSFEATTALLYPGAKIEIMNGAKQAQMTANKAAIMNE